MSKRRDWLMSLEKAERDLFLQWHVRTCAVEGRIADLEKLLTSPSWLEVKAEEGRASELPDDFGEALKVLPRSSQQFHLIALLGEALRTDVDFIARHPEQLFQCLWNRCWWYDCPEAAHHYDAPEGPWQNPDHPISAFLEKWRAAKEHRAPGFRWVRSLRPPEQPLGAIEPSPALPNHNEQITGLSFSADGRWLVTAAEYEGEAWIWDMATGMPHHLLREVRVLRAVITPDGRYVITGCWDGSVRVWNTTDGSLRTTLLGHQVKENLGLCVAPDSRRLVSWGDDYDGSVRLWDLERGEELCHWTEIYTHQATFSADGQMLAAGNRKGPVHLWDLASGALVTTLDPGERNGYWAKCLAFSPDGTRLAASYLWRIVVWELATGQRLNLERSDGEIEQLAFSADSQQLLARAEKGKVQLWNARVRVRPRLLEGLADVNALAADKGWAPLAATQEIQVLFAGTETAGGWFPAALTVVHASPTGGVFAGTWQKTNASTVTGARHLFLFRMEGSAKRPPAALPASDAKSRSIPDAVPVFVRTGTDSHP